MSAAIESLFSVRAADSDWVNDAARCILRVLGPSTADWWAVDWHRTGERTTAGTLAAVGSVGMAMGSGFPATTHVDLPARMARSGGLTTVTGVHFTAQGMLAVGEAGPYWVRLRNGFGELNVTMTVSDQ